MSDSFFEDNRAGDGELWGTALVDGDGSTNTLLHGFSLPNSLAAGDNLGLQKKLKQFFENEQLWLIVSVAAAQQILR